MKKQIRTIVMVCAMGIAVPFASQAQTNTNPANQPRTNQQPTTTQPSNANDGVGQIIQGLSRVDMSTMNYNNLSEKNFVDVREVLQSNQLDGLNTQLRANKDAINIQNQLNTRFRERNLLRENQEVVGVHSDGRYIIRNRQD